MSPLYKRLIIPFLIPALFFASCTKVIELNLNDAAPHIVIEGNVTNELGPYFVKITRTVNFSDPNIFPGVSGAVVVISDLTNVISDTLHETSPGVYETNIITGVPGHSYQLFVLADGNTYTSISNMPQSVNLDTITFIKTNLFGEVFINSVANFKDPAGIDNYYGFNLSVNGVKEGGTQLYIDRLADGKNISQDVNSDSLEIGNTVRIEMLCIDKGAYDYFLTLRDVTGGNNFQSVSPANPISNISNNALGYFSAHTVQVKEATVK